MSISYDPSRRGQSRASLLRNINLDSNSSSNASTAPAATPATTATSAAAVPAFSDRPSGMTALPSITDLPPSSPAIATAAAFASTMKPSEAVANRTRTSSVGSQTSRMSFRSENGRTDFSKIFNSTDFGKFLSKELPKIEGSTRSNVMLSKDDPLPPFDSSDIFKSKDSFSSIFSSKDWTFPIEPSSPVKCESGGLPPLGNLIKSATAAVKRNAVTRTPSIPSITSSISNSVLPQPSSNTLAPPQVKTITNVPSSRHESASMPAPQPVTTDAQPAVAPMNSLALSKPFNRRFSSRDWLPLQTLGTFVDVPITDDIFERQSSVSSLQSVAPQEDVLDVLPPSIDDEDEKKISGETDWNELFMSQLQFQPSPATQPSPNHTDIPVTEDTPDAEPEPPDPIVSAEPQYALSADPLLSFTSAQTFDDTNGSLEQPAIEQQQSLWQPVVTPAAVEVPSGLQQQQQQQRDQEPAEQAQSTASTSQATSGKKKRKRRPRKKIVPEVKEYVEPTNCDVLLGRGGRSNHHVGNKRYREEVKNLQKWYAETADKGKKTDLSQMLVDYVHSYQGRFLEKDENGWYIVPNIVARRKASQALREDDDPVKRAAKRARYLAKKKRLEEEAAAAAAAAKAPQQATI